MSNAEIAVAMDISVKGVEKLIATAKKKLRAEQVDRNEEEEGAGDAFVEESTVDDSTLGSDVEASQLRTEEGEQCREQDVRSEDGFVDLVPVRVAMTPLDA